ncbi:MAG: proton glutamate symport protein [Flavobacteriales bacterium]|jgi:proton glutamate symport protein|tara:strand:- start:18325 stop:19638 length:1314 start_codon:yes stop_codon:yes gene_type:complete
MKRKFPLHWQILIGLILGVLYGGGVSLFADSASSVEAIQEFTAHWIKPWGTIFVNSLKLIAVPLVLFSLVNGISGLKDVTKLGSIGGRAIGFYVITTVIAVSVGLLVVNGFKPWESLTAESGQDIIRSFSDKAEGKISSAYNVKGSGPLQFLIDLVPENIVEAASMNKNMLQVITFAILFGIALISIKSDKSEPVKKFFDGVNEVVLKMVDFIMYLAPIGTFALISNVFVQNSNHFGDLIIGIGGYFMSVIFALVLLALVLYPLILWVFAKVNPLQFLKAIAPAQLLAFSTSSSAATLPVTMDCVKNNVGVSEEITSFVLPLGATINMDGTSCYQAVAAVFIANVMGFDLTMMDQLTIVLTATLASIGSAAVPGAGMVMLAIVLGQLGVPMEGIGLILGVDRLLDMCRTVVNVTGDAMVSTVIAKQVGQLKIKSGVE